MQEIISLRVFCTLRLWLWHLRPTGITFLQSFVVCSTKTYHGFIQNFLVGVGKKHVHRATTAGGGGGGGGEVMLPQVEIYMH